MTKDNQDQGATACQWRALAGPAEYAAIVDDNSGREVARCYRYEDTKWAEDNAAAIIRDHNAVGLLVEALEAARDHLEYCGYGDKWERECATAAKLPEQISTALAAARSERQESRRCPTP